MTAERDVLMVAEAWHKAFNAWIPACQYGTAEAAHKIAIDVLAAALSQPQASPVGDWWYVVDKKGLAVAYEDESEARANVAAFDSAFPWDAPHRVAQLYEVAPGAGAAQEGFAQNAFPKDAIVVYKDGNMFCAVRADFINLQDSASGFGGTIRQAIDALETAAPQPAPAMTPGITITTKELLRRMRNGEKYEVVQPAQPEQIALSPACKVVCGGPPMGSVYRCCKPAGHAGEHSAFMPEAQDTFTPDEYEFEVWFGGRLWDSGIRSGESIVTTANERAAQAKAVALGPVEIKYFARADVTARLVGEQGEGTT